MQAKLRIVGGKNAGQEVAITPPKLAIGRGSQCQLRPKSDAIAEHHCDVTIEPGSIAVVDHGSKAGTLVNGQRITGRHELKAGDRLTVGPLEFDIVLIASVAGKKKPKVANAEEAASRMADGAREALDDISQWLSDDGGDETPAPSRYAAQLSDDELESMGKTPSGKPAPGNAPPAGITSSDATKTAANDVLNRLLKRP